MELPKKAVSTTAINEQQRQVCPCGRRHTGCFIDPENGMPYSSAWCYRHSLPGIRKREQDHRDDMDALRVKVEAGDDNAQKRLEEWEAIDENCRNNLYPACAKRWRELGLIDNECEGSS